MTYILPLLIGFILSTIGNYITIQWAKSQQLFEENDVRKIHIEKVSALGGIPVFIAFWITIAFFNVPMSACLPLLLATGILMLIGLEDDLYNTGVLRRLLAQVAAATIAFWAGFHFGWTGSILLDMLNFVASVFFVILMINSLNFIDGINGLAGGLGILTMLVCAGLFYASGLFSLTCIALAYSVVVGGFMVFNFGKKASIFMGDNGSTVLGFLMAIFALKLFQVLPIAAINAALPILITVIAIPILDLVSVVFIRLKKGKSPFVGDRTHIHHLLTDNGMFHPVACQFILLWLVGLIFLFYFEFVYTLGMAGSLIIATYVLVRMKYTISPVTVPAKWDKPKQQPSPSR